AVSVTVPHTIPGEKARIRIKRRRGKWAEGHLLQLFHLHPQRQEPHCPHFTQCGGCMWQHFNYEGQLAAKEDYVKSCLESAGFDSEVVHRIIGMADPWHYRNKMEFTFSPEGQLGLHSQGDFLTIIPLDACFIASGTMT